MDGGWKKKSMEGSLEPEMPSTAGDAKLKTMKWMTAGKKNKDQRTTF